MISQPDELVVEPAAAEVVPHTPAAYFAPNPRVGEGTMLMNSTVDTDQVASSSALDRFIPRDVLPEWVFETRTRFMVWAPTPEHAHQWFVDESESDIEVDTEILDFGTVALIGQTVRSMDQEPELRYVLTDKGRRELAMAQLFDRGPTVADVGEAA